MGLMHLCAQCKAAASQCTKIMKSLVFISVEKPAAIRKPMPGSLMISLGCVSPSRERAEPHALLSERDCHHRTWNVVA
jgi:hypothetical protein